jgi:hypothetical protein
MKGTTMTFAAALCWCLVFWLLCFLLMGWLW